MASLNKIAIAACVILLMYLLLLAYTVVERSDYARSQVDLMTWEISEMDRALPGACAGNEGMVDVVYANWIYLHSLQSNVNDRKLPWEQGVLCIESFDEGRMKAAYAEGLRKGSFDRAIDILESDAGDSHQVVKAALEELGRVM